MKSIALLGGTGPEGRGLALRFALAGLDVWIGSRDAARAAQTADELTAILQPHAARKPGSVKGLGNVQAAEQASIVCPVIPFRALPALLDEIRPLITGKLILDVTNPITRVKGQFATEAMEAGSTAQWIQQLAPEAVVVSGFKNLSAEELCEISHPLEGDILFCSDSPEALAGFIELTSRMPSLRGIDAGPLRNATFLEGITALLMNLNRRHKAITSIRILGL